MSSHEKSRSTVELAGSFVRDLRDGLLRLIFPPLCWTCDKLLEGAATTFCPACEAALTTDPTPTCPRCSSTIGPFVDTTNGCMKCRESVFHFDRAIRLGPYEGLLRRCILCIKHEHSEGLATALGEVWGKHARQRSDLEPFDVIVPVPLHWRRRWQRGFNQAEAVARPLAGHLGKPCLTNCLRRRSHTPHQTQQAPSRRWQNMRGAFVATSTSQVTGKSILLVDDVLTTGSTCSEAALALRSAGAVRVVVAVLAHGHASMPIRQS